MAKAKTDRQTLTMNKNRRKVSAPTHLSAVGRYHYQCLVANLKEQGTFSDIDKGAIEMLATLYSDYRDKSLSPKERRESIKAYKDLIKEYGGTPASRQAMKISAAAAQSEAEAIEQEEADLNKLLEES
jgi:phage terminase small subunit